MAKHLLLNETMIKNGNWKMNPPLREEIDRLATVEALLDGTACMIASDHAPHTAETWFPPLWKNTARQR